VSAPVVAVAGGPAKACAGIPLSSSPGDCGGVELDGIDIHAIKGITIYPNGTVETPVLRLAGKWDGRRLMLTSSPVVIDNSAVTRLPDCANGASQPSPALSQIQAAMQQDRQVLTSRGILVLKTAPCVDHLLVVVPVADRVTVGYLQARYSPIDVSSWLQPTSSSKGAPVANGAPGFVWYLKGGDTSLHRTDWSGQLGAAFAMPAAPSDMPHYPGKPAPKQLWATGSIYP
jgi:hypothetical protein